MNNAVILQQACSSWGGQYYEHLALTFGRHATYARMFQMDYRVELGDVCDEAMEKDGWWSKLYLVADALDFYPFVIWLDADAMIADLGTDLRAVRQEMGEAVIGVCQHAGPPVHLNIGVMYFRASRAAREFVADWIMRQPDPKWKEQGPFNRMAHESKYEGLVARVDDQWNSTWRGVNESPHPVVLGFHAGIDPSEKLAGMQAALRRLALERT